MSHQEILEKAISKAIEGGYELGLPSEFYPLKIAEYRESYCLNNALEYEDYDEIAIEHIIFNHDFAKCFFGTNEVCFNCGLEKKHDPYCAEQTFYDEAWKYHLRDMVLEEDSIQYLGAHL
jgi:hypothetical protein